MLFFDGSFLVLLAVVAAAMVVARGVRARMWLLIAASYVFYGAWDWRFGFLILGSTLLDWFVASRMPAADPSRRKRLLVVSLVSNLGVLAVFKYLDFGIASMSALLGLDLDLLGVVLPVGISFFTFQSMSYTIDVYRGELAPSRLDDVLLFVAFFPQLVAGPIIRAAEFLPQIQTALRRFPHHLEQAVPLFVLGLFKKTVIADNLAGVVEQVYASPHAYSAVQRGEATLAFAAQIYCDFSGYTDMALALCLMFGFTFPLNFRSPYLSRGPQEFWRRWHISLSTWLRDYLYKPLGGSHHGTYRLYAALFATMLLGGLWHGAAWTYVLWGVFHGTLLIVERLVRDRIPRRVRRVLTPATWLGFFALTMLGWVLFRAESMAGLRAMVTGLGAPHNKKLVDGVIWSCWGFVAIEHVGSELLRRWQRRPSWWPYVTFAVAGLMLAGVLLLRPVVNTPFIYFQF